MLLKRYHTLSNNKRKKPVSDVLTKAIKIIKIIASVKMNCFTKFFFFLPFTSHNIYTTMNSFMSSLSIIIV